MKRIYFDFAKQHLNDYEQMLFLEGPRQVGKTTIAKALGGIKPMSYYLNWDNFDDQEVIAGGPRQLASWVFKDQIQAEKKLLLLDEIQKYPRWKNFIKGFYDTYKDDIQLVLTGGSKLTAYKKGGDSLMGRYLPCYIHPLSIAECIEQTYATKEVQQPKKVEQTLLYDLLKFGGFPAPFLKASQAFYNRWSRIRFDQLIREDIRDLTRVQELGKIDLLAKMLAQQIGSLINYSNLGNKIGASSNAIQQWIEILQNNHYCFLISPWSKNITRSLIKNPKLYLWDWSLVKDSGARYENFIASHLLKAVHFWRDVGMGDYELYFLRDKKKREVDFLVTKNHTPWFLVEVKASKKVSLSKSLIHYQQVTQATHAFQVVFDLGYIDKDCFEYKNPVIVPAETFLSQLV